MLIPTIFIILFYTLGNNLFGDFQKDNNNIKYSLCLLLKMFFQRLTNKYFYNEFILIDLKIKEFVTYLFG
jgi:hypothetical protein